MIRATDAKEVGVENPAEETFRYPNLIKSYADGLGCQRRPNGLLESVLLESLIAELERLAVLRHSANHVVGDAAFDVRLNLQSDLDVRA